MNMSLRTIESFTKQEIFDFVAKKLLAQGHRSVVPSVYRPSTKRCSYHNETCDLDGPKCAVGHILSAEEHGLIDELNINGTSVNELFRAFDYQWPKDESLTNFLVQLQTAHDDAGVEESFLQSFTEAMEHVADTYELNADVLKDY